MSKLMWAIALASMVLGCGGGDRAGSGPVPDADTDARMLAAFARCVEETRAELATNNPDAPDDIMQMLVTAATGTCESAVVATCSQEPDGAACRVILDVYLADTDEAES